MVRRAGFGANGNVSFQQIALKYAGTDDPSSPAVSAYLVDYTGLSPSTFGRQIDKNESLHLADPDTRWSLARTMFQHESGKPVPFNRATFEQGIALATTVMDGGTIIITGSGPIAPIGSAPTTPTGTGPTTPAGTGPTTPLATAPTTSLPSGSMELIVGKVSLRFDASVDVGALSRVLDMLEKRL